MVSLLGFQHLFPGMPPIMLPFLTPFGTPVAAAEYVIASNPDLIVLADTVCCGQSAKTIAARPGWSNIAAVRSRDVLAVDDSVASEWGPRLVLFLKTVADELRRVEAHSR